MRPIIRLTNSEDTEWRRCKRKWWLGQYRGLTKKSQPIAGTPIAIGNVVHDSLAEYYATGADPAAHAKAYYDRLLEEHPLAEREVEKDRDLVDAMLTGYVEWLAETGADSEYETLSTETKLEAVLVDGLATVLSKIDARVRHLPSGEILAIEHKTTGSLTEQLPVLQMNTQMLTEHLVEYLHQREQGNDTAAHAGGVLWNMLRKVKRGPRANPPFYGRETVLHNVYELRSRWKHMVATALEIRAAEEALDRGESHHRIVPPNPKKECTWDCPFFQVCPLFDDGSDPEPMIDDLYEKHDPLERYWGAEAPSTSETV